jgi:hypothetical protein
VSVQFRPMRADDAPSLELQASQQFELGLDEPILTAERGADLATHGVAWTALRGRGARSHLVREGSMKALPDLIEGASAHAAGKFNREVMRTNETNARRDGAAEAQRLRDTARLAIGRQAAGLAASGFDGASGSALDAIRESSLEAELEQLQVRRRAEQAAMGYRSQGQIAYAQGYNAMSAGVVSGVNKVVDSFAGTGA